MNSIKTKNFFVKWLFMQLIELTYSLKQKDK